MDKIYAILEHHEHELEKYIEDHKHDMNWEQWQTAINHVDMNLDAQEKLANIRNLRGEPHDKERVDKHTQVTRDPSVVGRTR